MLEKADKQESKGITLIALVITIIVLLILAGVTLTYLTGSEGIIERAEDAKEQNKIASEKEQIQLLYMNEFKQNEEINEEKFLQGLSNNNVDTESVYVNGYGGLIIVTKDKDIYEMDKKGNVEYKGKKVVVSDAKPVMMKRDDKYAFWQEEYKNKITKIETKPYIISSYENSIEKWDVSKEKDKSVWAWISDDGNGGYELTIAANGKIILSDGKSLLPGFEELKDANLTFFDVSEITAIQHFFIGCIKVENINLKGWNTKNIEDMQGLFYNNNNLINIIGLEDFNTENVTDMGAMFYQCQKLEKFDVTNFNTHKVKTMGNMFLGCRIPSGKLDLSKWDTSSLENIGGMFMTTQCDIIDLSSFDVSKVTTYNNVFYGVVKGHTIYANEQNIETLKSWDEKNIYNIVIK